jgi:hypothetical protein
MHPISQPNPPAWEGFIFLAVGLLTLAFSPRLVAWQIILNRNTNRWLLNLVGYDGEFVLSQNEGDPKNESGLVKLNRSATWFGTILMGLLLVAFGMAVILKLKGVSIGS